MLVFFVLCPEREWRIKESLGFKYDQTEIIVPSSKYYKCIKPIPDTNGTGLTKTTRMILMN